MSGASQVLASARALLQPRDLPMPRYSLRSSLLIALVGLTASAMLVTGVVGTLSLRRHLLTQTDDQLRAAVAVAENRAAMFVRDDRPTDTLRSVVAVTGYLIEIQAPDGTATELATTVPLGGRPLLDLADRDDPDPQTVQASPGVRYRVMVVQVEHATVLVGLSLDPVNTTARRAGLTALGTAVLVLLLFSLVAWGLVVRRMRPLDEIAATATALAEGDLDRRVPAPDPADRAARTEVGRLSLAINGMLGRIQAALAARSRSEQRMRAFVADASHELRTPVTSIQGYLQLIRSGVVDVGRRPDVLRRLEEEATRIGALVSDLLYLARLDADPPARRESVDLVTVVADAVADARAVEPDRSIAVDLPDQCEITGDTNTLRQIMANLLANVRAHTPPGTPARVAVTTPESGWVRVTVADRGPGMPEDQTARVFDRFWRADPSRQATGGSGLGLAIVAEAVAACGGEVGVESAPGDGFTVWIRLPRDS